jgi:hypothetical protein
MLSFLFWNVNRKPLQAIIANLVLHYKVDVLMLAECSIAPAVLLRTLNQSGESKYHYAPSLCKKVQLFTSFDDKLIRPIFEADRLTIRRLSFQGRMDILLAVTHFPSKLRWSNESQAFECVELVNSIRMVENQVGHSRTALVGDLNMNPFEDGVVSTIGLNAVMSRLIASRRVRVVRAKEWPFFYNPMWSLFGDASPGPPGTYYYSGTEHKTYFWNMFDQVLIRPALLDLFSNQDLRIVETDGKKSFLSSDGLPDINIASDHLPIFFRLKL